MDLTAETFAQAWHASRRFRDEADGSGAPWLFGIARNLLRQYHKHNRIETAARERLGHPVAVAECEDYERVDERTRGRCSHPAAVGPCARFRPISAGRSSCGSSSGFRMRRSPVALGCSQNAARLRVSRALRALTTQMRSAQALSATRGG